MIFVMLPHLRNNILMYDRKLKNIFLSLPLYNLDHKVLLFICANKLAYMVK